MYMWIRTLDLLLNTIINQSISILSVKNENIISQAQKHILLLHSIIFIKLYCRRIRVNIVYSTMLENYCLAHQQGGISIDGISGNQNHLCDVNVLPC